MLKCSIVLCTVKLMGEGNAGSAGFELERSLASELAELREENLNLSQKLADSLTEMNAAMSALNKLTKAVFGPGVFEINSVPATTVASGFCILQNCIII